MKFTILGSNGFIGSNLVKYLKTQNHEVFTPKISEIGSENLGHVIYCIGITSDFRERPFDTVNSHVSVLNNFIKNYDFESFLYLSSTRVYMNSSSTEEEKSIIVNPEKFTEIYNISKIMGESICLSSKKPNIRIARLSNVIGKNFVSDDFIFSLIHDAIKKKKITLYSKLDSEKDYISIDDVVEILFNISTKGNNKIYNVANGENIRVEEITNMLIKNTKCQIDIHKNADSNKFKKINIDKINTEFKFKPKKIMVIIEKLLAEYKNE